MLVTERDHAAWRLLANIRAGAEPWVARSLAEVQAARAEREHGRPAA